jgi:hypothetical protein
MYPQKDKTPVSPAPDVAPSVADFYLPRGGGADPDFYLPEDRVHVPGLFSRWISGLPVFGRRRL